VTLGRASGAARLRAETGHPTVVPRLA